MLNNIKKGKKLKKASLSLSLSRQASLNEAAERQYERAASLRPDVSVSHTHTHTVHVALTLTVLH